MDSQLILISLLYAMLWVCRQPGQTSSAEVKKLDLRAELLLAEQEARNKKRKAEGKPLIESPAPDRLAITNGTDDESHKRRKLLEDVIDLDRDDDDDDRVEGERKQESDSEEDEDEEEDETAELLRELEKIKRERAEEKARQVHPRVFLLIEIEMT
jgi:protein CWC15